MNTAADLLNTTVGDYRIIKFLGINTDTCGVNRSWWRIKCEGCGGEKTKNQKQISQIKGICQICTGTSRSKRFGYLLEKRNNERAAFNSIVGT